VASENVTSLTFYHLIKWYRYFRCGHCTSHVHKNHTESFIKNTTPYHIL